MADHILEWCVWLPRPRVEVFAFFANPGNLARITPPTVRPRLAAPVPGLQAGTVFDLRVRWLGIPVRWRVFIREYDPPFRFVDVQVRGPFARWEHRHRFLEEDGGTLVEDRVTYRLPLGVVGRLLHALVVRRQLRAAWSYRDRCLGAFFGPLRASHTVRGR
jgi:ligand-binding SRPBCC domain-containing protein